ncbi:MAG: hypothetical protein ACEQSR_16580 [Candidatus Methylacidiphilales bacterium]
MKNLVLNEGFPQALTDYWLLLDSNTKDAFTLAMKPYAESTILSGCELTVAGANLNIAAGVVYFDGQLMRVAAHSIADYEGAIIIAQRYDTTLLANPKVYGNGSIGEPMLTETKCRFIKKTTEVDYKELKDFLPFGIIAMAKDGAGYNLAAGILWQYEDGSPIAEADRLVIKKTIDNKLVFEGFITPNTSNSTTVNGVANCSLLCTLDAAFRPNNSIFFTSYAGVVSGAYSLTPVLEYAFVLFPDGKLCQRATNSIPYSFTSRMSNIQLYL